MKAVLCFSLKKVEEIELLRVGMGSLWTLIDVFIISLINKSYLYEVKATKRCSLKIVL